MINDKFVQDLIVIEGSDGSGKKTQSEILRQYIDTHTHYKAKLWDFPDYQSETGRLISDMLHGKFGTDAKELNAYFTSPMYSLDRYRYIHKENPEDYDDDTIVVCNRYTMSNVIHQGARLSDEEIREYIMWLYDYEFDKLMIPMPSITVFLYVPYEVSYSNMMKRYEGKLDKLDINEQKEYLKLVDDNVKRLRKLMDEWYFIDCIDGSTGNMFDMNTIAAIIREQIGSCPCVSPSARESF